MFKLFFGKNRMGSGRVETRRIGIKGLAGKANAKTVKKALLTKTGVREVYINRDEGIVTVLFDPALTDVPALSEVILRKGYIASAIEE
jgi:copper chaperone CopZ